MGRDKPTKVEGTPHGLGLYRRQGREGYFFIKNWSHLAKRHPGAFERGGQYDEWIKRADGSLVLSLNEAKAYCYRRTAELELRKLALKGDFITYSGEDLEGIAQQLADQWVRAKQRGLNLQHIDLGIWRAIELFKNRIEDVERTGLGGALVMPPMSLPEDDDLPPGPFVKLSKEQQELVTRKLQEEIRVPENVGPTYWLPLPKLKEENQKLERLCWDQGYRPCPADLQAIRERFASLILNHIDSAEVARERGEVRPPKPSLPDRGINWDNIILAKEAEGIASGTRLGIRKAMERLANWLLESAGLRLPSAIDWELAAKYRSFLFHNSGLKETSAAKEIRYLRSAFQAATNQNLIDKNPFSSLPRDRRSKLRTQIASQKTVDKNKIIRSDQFREIYQVMSCNKQGRPDPGFDLFLLQALTGTRIQEVAGLRKCDFSIRKVGDKTFRCIEIRHWDKRGLGAMGSRGGLKTVQSQRVIPVPRCVYSIWSKYSDPNSEEPAFPEEAPISSSQHWGDRLSRRMRDKCNDFSGTHSWRETLINNTVNHGLPLRIIEMITGKTSNTSLLDYTSDDLALMQRALEIHSERIGIGSLIRSS